MASCRPSFQDRDRCEARGLRLTNDVSPAYFPGNWNTLSDSRKYLSAMRISCSAKFLHTFQSSAGESFQCDKMHYQCRDGYASDVHHWHEYWVENFAGIMTIKFNKLFRAYMRIVHSLRARVRIKSTLGMWIKISAINKIMYTRPPCRFMSPSLDMRIILIRCVEHA